MATIRVGFNHDLGVEKAKTAVDKAITHYRELYPSYQLHIRWESESDASAECFAQGFHITGQVHIDESGGIVSLRVPFFLKGIITRATDDIDAEIERWVQAEKESA